jgi:hypothetical protein
MLERRPWQGPQPDWTDSAAFLRGATVAYLTLNQAIWVRFLGQEPSSNDLLPVEIDAFGRAFARVAQG